VLGRAIRWLVPGILIAGGIIRLAGWQGIWRPVRISGSSMAPTLVGEHYRLICQDCGSVNRYDAAALPRDGRVICWNCGAVNHHVDGGPWLDGRRVWVDRWAYSCRAPQRWEIVAFPAVDDESRFAVKRIVGLPGERIAFRQGDLVVDGRIVRKSLSQLRDMAVLVHDNAHQPRPASGLPPRWQSQSTTNRWRALGTRLIFEPGALDREAFEWLSYHHWPGYAGTVPRTQPSPILDNDSYNQQLSRRLNPVTDLLLACRITTPGCGGRLALELAGPTECYRVELRFDRRELALLRNSRELTCRSLPRFPFARGVLVELAWCDGQLLFGIGGHELIRRVIVENAAGGSNAAERTGDTAADHRDTQPQIRVGAAGLTATLDRLLVFRDIYYLPSESATIPARMSWHTGPDELFLVGDNVPVSQDSRQWPHSGVPIERLLGRVW
jgi:signal peptidase I